MIKNSRKEIINIYTNTFLRRHNRNPLDNLIFIFSTGLVVSAVFITNFFYYTLCISVVNLFIDARSKRPTSPFYLCLQKLSKVLCAKSANLFLLTISESG